MHRRGPWQTRKAVELATLQRVSWFSQPRLPEPIGHTPQADAEATDRMQKTPAASTPKAARVAAQQERRTTGTGSSRRASGGSWPPRNPLRFSLSKVNRFRVAGLNG